MNSSLRSPDQPTSAGPWCVVGIVLLAGHTCVVRSKGVAGLVPGRRHAVTLMVGIYSVTRPAGWVSGDRAVFLVEDASILEAMVQRCQGQAMNRHQDVVDL